VAIGLLSLLLMIPDAAATFDVRAPGHSVPYQRVLKYGLILKEILKHTTVKAEVPGLEAAQRIMQVCSFARVVVGSCVVLCKTPLNSYPFHPPRCCACFCRPPPRRAPCRVLVGRVLVGRVLVGRVLVGR